MGGELEEPHSVCKLVAFYTPFPWSDSARDETAKYPVRGGSRTKKAVR